MKPTEDHSLNTVSRSDDEALSLRSIQSRLAERQTHKPARLSHRASVWAGSIAAAIGFALTLINPSATSVFGLSTTSLGLVIEVTGLLVIYLSRALFLRNKSPRKNGTDLDDYDAFHSMAIETISWIATFKQEDIASLRRSLSEQRIANEIAYTWLLGPADKLGIAPVMAAIFVQAVTLTSTQSRSGTILAGLLLGSAISYAVVTFSIARERVRDQHIGWLLEESMAVRDKLR